MRYLLTISIILASYLSLRAQTFPVQVNTQILPPFSPYLSDYTVPGAQKLMVNILLKDPTLPEYSSKLRLTIEGVGITIRTRPSYVPSPLMLPGGGIPLLLYGEDIAEYFDPANLDFSGITRSQYQKGAKLPDGVYRFTIEVLDYNRGTPVSNKGTTVAWIILNDPPLLNFPRRDTKVQIIDPTNIAFSWTPRHTASPNAAFTTEYNFKLVEIWPVNRNPFDAMLSQPALYELTTNFSQIIYGPAEPALIPGRKYAWQVQARDEEGRDLFKNQGKSEVYVFQFGDALGAPDNVRLQTTTPSALTVRWDQPVAGSETITYRVRYRPAGNPAGPWYEDTTEELWRTIPSLQADKDYEVQIRAEQTTQLTDYTAPKIFRTKVAGANDFACSSDIQPPPQPNSTQPLFKLGINDTIRAGGYDVVVRKVSGSNGTYTGEGVAIVPWFMSAKVRVTFDKIGVNEQYWLTSGTIKSVWDANSKFLLKPETKPGNEVIPDVGENSANIAETETLIEIKTGLIVAVTENEDGDVVVETSSGETQVVPKGTSASIVDSGGNGYIVDKEGNIAKTTADAAREAYNKGQREYNLELRFAKGNGKFGFDEKKFDALASYYQHLNDDSYIPWKAVSSFRADGVDAILEGENINAEKIRFEVDGSVVTPQTNSDNKLTFSLIGKTEGTEEEFVAYYQDSDSATQKVIGKLNLVSYDKITKNVVIVPVNMDLPSGLSAPTVKTALDQIYEQAAVYWQVNTANRINVTFDQAFDDGQSGLLSNYTNDMKKVITAYGQLQDETYYLFLINNQPKSGGNAMGYMPRSKQAGFVFAANHNDEAPKIIRTMAHELGHGVFNLKHTFSEFPGLSVKGITLDNLMDYPNGNKLYKYQWDYIHDPQRVIPLFEDDEEGESTGVDACQLKVSNLVSELQGAKKNSVKFKIDINKYLFNCLFDFKIEDLKYIVTGDLQNIQTPGSVDVVVSKFMFKTYVLENKFALPKTISIDGAAIKLKVTEIINGEIDLRTIEVLKEIGPEHVRYKIQFNPINASDEIGLAFELYDLDELTTFLNYLGFNGQSYREKLADELVTLLKGETKCDVIDVILEKLPVDIIKSKLSYADQIAHLKTLSACLVDEAGSDEESAVLRLLEGIENSTQLIKDLRGDLIRTLDSRMNGDNYFKFVVEVSNHVINATPCTDKDKANALLIKAVLNSDGKGFRYNLNFQFSSILLQDDARYDVYFEQDGGKLIVQLQSQWTTSSLELPEKLDPFSYVSITIDPSAAKELGLPTEIQFVPAIFFKAVALDQKLGDGKKILRTGVDAALFAVGGISGGSARTFLGKAFFYADIILPSIDIAVQLSDLSSDPAFADFKEVYNTIYTSYAILSVVRLTTPLFQSKLDNFVGFWRKNRDKCNLTGTQKTQIDQAVTKIENELQVAKGISVLTKAMVKEKLPNTFMEAMKKFGKTEDEILEYFTNYHNVRSNGKFFKDIDDFIAYGNVNNLTKDEAFALWGYTTNFFYRKLNDWLRTGDNILTTKDISSLINSGLGKISNYSAKNVYRGITIESGVLQNFLNNYKKGAGHTWNDFSSCGGSIQASFGNRPEVNIIFEIEHKTAKEISNLADGIKYGGMPRPEILIKSGSTFEVVADPVFDASLGSWIIKVKQLN